MLPALSLGPVSLPAYGTLVVLAFGVAAVIRGRETRRLGHTRLPGYRWVLVGALLGAAVGAKLGMILFTPLSAVGALLAQLVSLDFTGKTVIGGLVGGFVGVEAAKRLVGIRSRTGDGFAVAVPAAQGVARLGCLLHGCCYGTEWAGPWAVQTAGALRHPAPLYEAVLCLGLAAWLWSQRARPLPTGNLFRRYLVGYALIRFGVEFFRGDPARHLGPLTAVQVLCLVAALGFGWGLWRSERSQG